MSHINEQNTLRAEIQRLQDEIERLKGTLMEFATQFPRRDRQFNCSAGNDCGTVHGPNCLWVRLDHLLDELAETGAP